MAPGGTSAAAATCLGDLVCSAASIGLVDETDVELLVQVDPAAAPGTVVTFAATLTSSNALTSVQTKSSSVIVAEPADLHVEMSAPASAASGTSFPTTITLTNHGPASAAETRVVYTQTGSAVYGPMTGPAGWSCVATTCTIGSLAAGATATFTVPTSIPGYPKSGLLTSQVNAYTDNDPNFADNGVTMATVVVPPPQATLKLTLTASPAVVYTGDQLTYTAQIVNTSNVDVQGAVFSWGQAPGPVIADTCGSSDQCTFWTIAAGATQTVTRTIHVDAGAATVLTQFAMVAAPNVVYDGQLASATLSTTVAGVSHVDLEPEIAVLGQVHAGATAGWMYGIANHGPDTATDWQISIPLPANTTLASYSGLAGSCSGLTPNAANTVVTCHGTSLPFQLVLHLMVAPGTTAPIHATAIVSTANIESNTQNNTVAVDTLIVSSAELSMSNTTDKTAAVTGERVTQTFTVTNQGPDAASGVVLDVTLPAGSSFSTMTSTFASCTGTAPIHCAAPTLGVGDTLSATISFQSPQTPGYFSTHSHASWTNSATPYGYADAYTHLQVIAPPLLSDVTVALDATPSAAQAGDVVTYAFAATNVGNSPASAVTVQLDLPAALTFLSASPQCTGTAPITCSVGTLSGGGSSATFLVTARAAAAGSITATATVSTTSSEWTTGNNGASTTIVVSTRAEPPPVRRRAARH